MADVNYYDPANHETASKIVGQGNFPGQIFGRRAEVFLVDAGQL
jgi:hypothetical protein